MKRIQGTDRPDRLPENEARPDLLDEVPDPPEWLSDPARGMWEEYAPKLVRLGLLTEIDVPVFGAMCSHYGLMVSAATDLKEGVTKDGYRGHEKKHPAAQVFRDNSSAFRAYAALFGMSPAERSRVSAVVKEDEPEGILSLVS